MIKKIAHTSRHTRHLSTASRIGHPPSPVTRYTEVNQQESDVNTKFHGSWGEGDSRVGESTGFEACFFNSASPVCAM